MSLFRRKAKITSFVATGIRYDGSDADSNMATDDFDQNTGIETR